MNKPKRRSWQLPLMLAICLFMGLLNLLARLCPGFADWYTMQVFLPVSEIWTRISGLCSFSIGEILIALGILLLLVTPVSLLILLIVCKTKRRKILSIYGLVYGWILTWILSTETLHCFIQYQCTTFGDKYFPDAPESYTSEEVLSVYAQLVDAANDAAKEVQRDESGRFLLTDDLYSSAKASMLQLGTQYPQYAGFYPDPKPIFFSSIMTQQWLLGIYYPFTMEANYNRQVYEINLPVTLCHEYTHLKGNLFEDEANFISFLACTQSESADFRYSGYLMALEYMMNEVWELEGAADIESQLDPLIWNDLYAFVPEETWTEIEEEAVIDSDLMEEVSDVAADTTLKLNGVEDGMRSYSRMVNLVMHYYLQATPRS